MSELPLLFDADLVGVGRSLSYVYTRARTMESVTELGQRASDIDIVRWCGRHHYVWVTADWRSASQDVVTVELKRLGVSAIWVRQEVGNLSRADILYVLARDLRIIEAELAAASPIHYVCTLGARPRRLDLAKPPALRQGRPRRPRLGS